MATTRCFIDAFKSRHKTDGLPQNYDMVRSAHNKEMDGDKQVKQALLINKGRQTKLQPDTEGKKGVRETKFNSSKNALIKKGR